MNGTNDAARKSEGETPVEHARLYGSDTDVLEWREKLVCSKCGSRHVDMVPGRATAALIRSGLHLSESRTRMSALTEEVRFAMDSPVEGDGFELPVPEREDRVSSLGLLLARDRGVGADVSIQPGFVIIMPSPREASGAPLCCSPVDPEDDERDQVPTITAICRTEGCKYFGVDKSAEITVNWSMRFGLESN
jgi:hypothetical protein